MTTWELAFLEVSPPGREPQVRALKGKVDNPYAVAWASYNKGEEAELSSKKRNKLKKKSFAIPEERKFPIHDASHARNALARASGTKYEKRVKAAVHRRYPSIGAEANSSGGLPQTLRGQKQAKTMCGSTDWGAKVPNIRQADQSILKLLLQETVESKTYRFSESNLMEVVAPVVSAKEAEGAPEGPMVKCVLITEGLGNRADMHYYGPECIRNGVGLFEGQPCFIDHQKRSDQQDQPERTVRDKCGYFKNVRVDRDENGRLGLFAELHYDLSETGRYAYDKACTAIHYKQEFPDSDKEYVGLSIAADGRLEERSVQVGDEVLDVKYVTEFTAVGSVDEVTSPARGGRFVQVLSR